MDIFAILTIDRKTNKFIDFRFTDETIRRVTDIEFFKNIKARQKQKTNEKIRTNI